MPQAFISYSHQDIDFAKYLVSSFSAYDVPIWIDYQRIIAGDDWRVSINDGLNKSDVMVLVISPDSVKSVEVQREWNYWLTKKGKDCPIIIVVYKDAEIPYEIYNLQRIDKFTQVGGFDDGISELLMTLSKRGFDVNPLYTMCFNGDVNTTARFTHIEAQYLIETIRRLAYELRLASQGASEANISRAILQRKSLDYLTDMRVSYNVPLNDVRSNLYLIQQLIMGKWMPEVAGEFWRLYQTLRGQLWLEGVNQDEGNIFHIIRLLPPDDTLLADLLAAARNIYDVLDRKMKTIEYQPPISSKIHKKMVEIGLDIITVSAFLSETHDTQQPASFIQTRLGYVRVDWKSEPSAENISQGENVVQDLISQFWYLKSKALIE